MAVHKLTAQQRLFAHEYLVDRNATQAAIRAGYSEKSACSQANALLRKLQIRNLVDTGLTKLAEKADLTAERVMRELATLALSDIQHYIIDGEGRVRLADGAPEDAMRAVSGIKHRSRKTSTERGDTYDVNVELKLWDKPASIRLAGSHIGLWKDNAQQQGATILVIDPYATQPEPKK